MFVDMPANRTGYLHKASILQDMSEWQVDLPKSCL